MWGEGREELLSPCKELFIYFFLAGFPIILTGCEEGKLTKHVSLVCSTGYTIVVTKGICVRVTACNAFDMSSAASCIDFNKVSEGVFNKQLPTDDFPPYTKAPIHGTFISIAFI